MADVRATSFGLTDIGSIFTRSASEAPDYSPLLKWLLVNCLVALGLFTLWRFGFLDTAIQSDHTRISLLIFGLFVITSLHCLAKAIEVSKDLIAMRRARAICEAEASTGFRISGDDVVTGKGTVLPRGPFASHVANLIRRADVRGKGHLDQTLLLRNVADRLRAREKIGVFVSEALLRLALLGTAIGFILMLIPIATLSSFETDTLRSALSGMTAGMAVALNVTVSGIGAALVLKYTYYQLDHDIADLFHLIAETSEIYVVPAIERAADGRE